jgi:hypothetical protein
MFGSPLRKRFLLFRHVSLEVFRSGAGVLCAEQPGIVSPLNANSNRIDVYSPSRLSYPPCSILSFILPFLLLFRSLPFRTLLFVSIPVNS